MPKPSHTPLSPKAKQLLGGRKLDRFELLRLIGTHGSISAAAKELGMSYKSAWEALEGMNNLSEAPLVERVAGGHHGGGTRLTPHGEKVLSIVGSIQTEFSQFLNALGTGGEPFERFIRSYELLRRWDMRTSARNQFLGRVKSISPGAVNAEVILDLGNGEELVAIVTNHSVGQLELVVGKEAYALVKASWVILTTDSNIKTSARNQFCGVVVDCIEGAVNGEVIIELPSGKTLAATLTNESIRLLGLKEGIQATALIKASHVILAVNN